MSVAKKRAFNEKMGMLKQFPNHLRLKNGGLVKRKKMDDGGIATNSTASGAGATGGTNAVANTNNSSVIGNALGLNNGFQAGAANISSGTNATQLDNAYTGAQNGINAQVGLANTFVPQANQAVNEQNNLAQQYQNTIAGTGPNAAQTQFAANTSQNVANQDAMAAGQRGAASNVGLLERQAAQQGANTEQQAAGQAATTQANQQIAAQQNLANLATTQSGQATNAVTNLNQAQQNEQNILQGANTAYNNAEVGMQSNLNSTNAQTAAANQNMQGNLISSVASGIGSVFAKGGEVKGYADGGYTQVVSAGNGGPQIPNVSQLPEYNPKNMYNPKQKDKTPDAPDLDLPELQQPNGMLSGTQQPNVTITNNPNLNTQYAPAPTANDLQAPTGMLSSNENGFADGMNSIISKWKGGECKGPYQSHVANFMYGGGMAKGGKVPVLLSPKEVKLTPDQVKEVVEKDADPMKIGYHVPGKDKVKGKDSKKNDFVPDEAEEGSVIVPIHISTHKKASEKSRKFVKNVAAKHMKSPKAGN